MDPICLDVQKTVQTDVLVIGGGVAGCCAALAAAREGVSVMLAEQTGALGGSATLTLVSPVGSIASRSGKPFGGLSREIFDEVSELSRRYAGADSDPLASPHILKYVLLDKLVKAGVSLQLHSRLVSAETGDGRILRAALITKSGIKQVEARCYIDATGDGDLIALAGDRFSLGCEPDAFQSLIDTGLDMVHEESGSEGAYRPEGAGGMQPVSSMFVLGGVDEEKGRPYINRLLTFDDLHIDREEFARSFYYGTPGFEENGDLIPLPQGRVLFFRSCRRGEVVVNMSRMIGIDATDEEQLTRGEIGVQLQVLALTDFLKRYVPGFEDCYLIESSWLVGIRETRRLVGPYVLTGGDVITCRKFPDTIAHGSYIIDIHDPYGKRKAIGGHIRGDYYSIPYRCLLSSLFGNLAAAGRCICADHVAHSSTRIQGTGMMTGQAAGTAAALCVGKGSDFSGVDVTALQRRLRERDVFLDPAE